MFYDIFELLVNNEIELFRDLDLKRYLNYSRLLQSYLYVILVHKNIIIDPNFSNFSTIFNSDVSHYYSANLRRARNET
jgi:hypothetical protein